MCDSSISDPGFGIKSYPTFGTVADYDSMVVITRQQNQSIYLNCH